MTMLGCLAALLVAVGPPLAAETGASAQGPSPRIALVLSGGSALGMAHAGVIEVIEAAGIPIDMVLGTSMGSIVGGLYAAGYSPAEMQDFVSTLDWSSVFSERRDNPGDRYDIAKERRFPAHLGFDGTGLHLAGGLLKGQNVMTLFTGLTLNILARRDFDKLPVPYRAVAADILTGEKVVFSSGSIAEAMRSSMSIPGLFEPWKKDGRLLVDGGIVDNMPVDLARGMGADIVIAVECRTQAAKDPARLNTSLAITTQTLALYIEENMRPSRAAADLLVKPDLSRFSSSRFSAGAALVEKGRADAETFRPALDALARKIAERRPLVIPETEPNRSVPKTTPVLSRLSFEGGSAADREFAAACFSKLTGRTLERAALTSAIDLAFSSGRFDLVTFELVAEDEGRAVGIVRLESDVTTRNDVMLGGNYRGIVSPLSSSESTLRPALYLGELTGKDSALFLEFGLLGIARARFEYFQPFGPFYLKPSLNWEAEYDSWPLGEGLGIRSYFRRAGGRFDLGINLGKRGEVEAGWGLQWVRASSLDDPSRGLSQEALIKDSRLGMLEARIDYDNYDRFPFPSRGISLSLDGRYADPLLGGDTSFAATDLGARLAFPLSRRLSLSAAFFAGTDFSGFVSGLGQLPSSRWYSLRHPGMFHGIEARPDREIGNHVAGLGVEAALRIGRLNAMFGGDVYALANLSAGAAKVTDDPSADFLPLRWDGCVGLGTRIYQHFGALATLGFVYDANNLAPLRPALSIEIGSLEEYHEDRR
jgi:NTE family protein